MNKVTIKVTPGYQNFTFEIEVGGGQYYYENKRTVEVTKPADIEELAQACRAVVLALQSFIVGGT